MGLRGAINKRESPLDLEKVCECVRGAASDDTDAILNMGMEEGAAG